RRDVTWPNVLVADVLTPVFGMPNCTRLNRLKASARSVRLTPPWSGVVFDTARFQLLTPCPRRSGSVRGALPSCHRSRGSAFEPAFGTLKQLVLNHWSSRSSVDPLTDLSQFGSTFGRSP